jgi:hypothetical protein
MIAGGLGCDRRLRHAWRGDAAWRMDMFTVMHMPMITIIGAIANQGRIPSTTTMSSASISGVNARSMTR